MVARFTSPSSGGQNPCEVLLSEARRYPGATGSALEEFVGVENGREGIEIPDQ